MNGEQRDILIAWVLGLIGGMSAYHLGSVFWGFVGLAGYVTVAVLVLTIFLLFSSMSEMRRRNETLCDEVSDLARDLTRIAAGVRNNRHSNLDRAATRNDT